MDTQICRDVNICVYIMTRTNGIIEIVNFNDILGFYLQLLLINFTVLLVSIWINVDKRFTNTEPRMVMKMIQLGVRGVAGRGGDGVAVVRGVRGDGGRKCLELSCTFLHSGCKERDKVSKLSKITMGVCVPNLERLSFPRIAWAFSWRE